MTVVTAMLLAGATWYVLKLRPNIVGMLKNLWKTSQRFWMNDIFENIYICHLFPVSDDTCGGTPRALLLRREFNLIATNPTSFYQFHWITLHCVPSDYFVSIPFD